MNVVLIGGGHVVRTKHREAYEALKGRITPFAIVDPNEGARRETGEVYSIPKELQFSSLDDLGAIKKRIDMAVIATPQGNHCQNVLFAAENGWHILCEKPLAMNMNEVNRAVAAAKRAGVHFGVVHNFYYSTITAESHSLIKRGVIGSVRFVRCEGFGSYYDPNSWWTDKAISGYGHFFTCMYHEVYLTRRAVNSPVRKVYAQSTHLTSDPKLVEDTVVCQMEFENGAMAVFIDCAAFPNGGGGARIFETHGAKGSILRNFPMTTDCGFLFAEGRTTPIEKQPEFTPHGMHGVFDAFVASIEGGRDLPYEISAAGDGLDTMQAVLWAYESAERGQPIVV